MDIVLIRITLIFLLVFYHAFSPFTGAWAAPPSDHFHSIELYKWLGLLSHYFQLEAMVFISGLLFGHTLVLHPERLNFNGCVVKKAKRILLPGLLFSVIYYLMFYDLNAPLHIILTKLLNGCGHLWFLPMIFWCFVVCYLTEKLTLPPPFVLAVSIFALLVPALVPILGLGRLPHFFFYFYFGFAIKKGYVSFVEVKNKTYFILLPIIYVALCICNEMILENWHTNTFVENAMRALFLKTTHFLCAFSMIVFLYSLANRPYFKHCLERSPKLITLSGYCYGVYIYQQFILKYIYYNTTFTYHMPVEVFPWIGFIATLVLSLLFCHVTLKTKCGRYLIG